MVLTYELPHTYLPLFLDLKILFLCVFVSLWVHFFGDELVSMILSSKHHLKEFLAH